MNTHRRLIAVVLAALLMASACSSKDDEASGATDNVATDGTAEGTDGGESDTTDGPVDGGDAAILGDPNPATGEPLRVGFVNEGNVPGIDQTALVDVYGATVDYVNEYLGGINGRPLEVVTCETGNTPAGATECGVQMLNENVAAILTPVSAQDQAIFTAIDGHGIPYVTFQSATEEIILSAEAFVQTNLLAGIAAPAYVARELGIDKVALVLIDVPAATAAVGSVGPTFFGNAGVEFQLVSISPSVADMAPQIQGAINSGSGLIAVGGTDQFNADAVEAIQQLGYEGEVHLGGLPSQVVIDSAPDGLEGVRVGSSSVDDENDPDVQLFNAVVDTYIDDYEFNVDSLQSFAVVLGFWRALDGVTEAVDAPSIMAALQNMPEPVELPLGGGISFQCGAAPVAFAPGICTADTLETVLDAEGNGTVFEVIDVSDILALG